MKSKGKTLLDGVGFDRYAAPVGLETLRGRPGVALLFIAAAMDEKFRAIDKATGEILCRGPKSKERIYAPE